MGNVRRRLERRCGFAFGDGVVPALVTLEALSRADVVVGSNGTTGVMFIKRYKGDKKQQWPAKQFSPAVGGKLCALALRLVYERLNPVPWNVDPSTVPYWQLPDTLPLTRTNLLSFFCKHI